MYYPYLNESSSLLTTASNLRFETFSMETLNYPEIIGLTEKYVGLWGLNHARRIIKMVEIIGKGQDYNKEVIWVAAHLHDWGASSPWFKEGVDHAVRSKQVASQILPLLGLPAEFIQQVEECIEMHHTAGNHRCTEAVLLSDADALDFLGIVGVLRDFAKKPKDLKNAISTVRKRMSQLPGQLRLERSRAIAEVRLQEMNWLLDRFEEETFQLY